MADRKESCQCCCQDRFSSRRDRRREISCLSTPSYTSSSDSKNPEFRAFRLSEYSILPIIGSSWSPLCTLLFLLAVEDAKKFVAEIIKLPAPARHRHIFIRRPLRDVLEQRCYQSDIRAAGKLHAPLN